ncbi:hypothetical protein GCM10027080_16210 [Pedococcus soli]
MAYGICMLSQPFGRGTIALPRCYDPSSRDPNSLEAAVKSTRGPLVLAVAGAVLAVVSAVTALAASLGAQARGSGAYGVVAHDGWAPGSVPALVMLAGLLLVGVGAALHDGRRLRTTTTPRTAPRSGAAPAAPPATVRVPPPVGPVRPVYLITSLPERVLAPVPTPRPRTTRPQTTRPQTTRPRHSASGARLELVGASRRR